MAKILRRHLINTVKTSYLKCTLLLALCWAAVVLCTVSAFYSYGITLIFLIPLSYFIYRLFHQRRALKSGMNGEKSCLKLLSLLPKGYFVIPDVTLHIKNKTAQLDYIIISKSGVFIVEAKNHGGVISGSFSEPRLYKLKHINGKPETSNFYNPAYQLSTHMRLMRELLYSEGFHAEVFGAVYFSNPRTVLELDASESTVPIFSFKQNGEKRLLSYLCSKTKTLSASQVKRLKSLIFSYCS